jgi:integrase
MDIKFLSSEFPKLIEYMKAEGYNNNYIMDVRSQIKYIIYNNDSKNWNSYEDIYKEYINPSRSKKYLQCKQTIIRIIENFDIYNQLPTGKTPKFIKKSKYQYLSTEFKYLIDYFTENISKIKNIKSNSISHIVSVAGSFLYDLEQIGINNLSQISEKSVLSLFIDQNGTILRQYQSKSALIYFFKFCSPINQILIESIISFFPYIPKKRKNIQYLQPEEIVTIKKILNTIDSGLTLRDKAIVTIGLYSGLRSCDIANLTLNSINWDKDLICIKQQKTGIDLELPMSAIIGNSIYKYLTEERPKSDSEYLFLSNSRPYLNLSSSGVRCVADKLMKLSEIRQNIGDRRGFHLFRHRVVTKFLDNDVPIPVISKILGHTSPKSLDPYLSADLKHLKECSISIEKYPIIPGIFIYE